MTNQDYEAHYNSVFEAEYEKLITDFTNAYNDTKDGHKVSKKMVDFRNSIIERINNLTIKRPTPDTIKEDRYYKDIIERFRYSRDDYEEDQFYVRFLDTEIPLIKETIVKHKFEIVKPEVYNASKKETLKNIAIYYSKNKFLEYFPKISDSEKINLEEIIKILRGERKLNEPSIETIDGALNGNKIEWLGSQKNLAELFVELKAKGWIKDINVKVIKAAFDKTTTISQTLKPGKDTQSREETYPGIYTPQGKFYFDKIKAR